MLAQDRERSPVYRPLSGRRMVGAGARKLEWLRPEEEKGPFKAAEEGAMGADTMRVHTMDGWLPVAAWPIAINCYKKYSNMR